MKHSTVAGFTKSLRQALFDKTYEVEQRIQPRFYFDADVLVRLFLGLDGGEFGRSDDAAQLDLLAALLSWGALAPRAHVLTPHARELLNNLDNAGGDNRGHASGDYRKRVRAYLKDTGLEHTLRAIQKEYESARSSTSTGNVSPALLDLAEEAPRMLIALEKVRVPWQTRMRELWNHTIVLDDSPYSVDAIAASDDFHRFMAYFSRRRPSREQNNANDAIALAYISSRIAGFTSDSHTPVELVRLCSTTRSFEDMYSDDADTASLLRQPAHPQTRELHWKSDVTQVLREPGYFVVRVMFPQLRPPNSAIAPDRNAEVTHKDLRKLLGDLEAFVDNPLGEAQHIWQTSVHGRPVRSMLEEYERLIIARDIVLAYPVERASSAAQILKPSSLLALWGFARSKLSEAKFVSNITILRSELDQRLEGHAEWVDLYRRVIGAASERLDRIHRERHQASFAVVPDAMRDLGLVRWGLSLDDGRKSRLTSILAALTTRDRTDLWEPAGQTVRIVRSAERAGDCVLAASILFHLGLWGDIVALVDRYTSAPPSDEGSTRRRSKSNQLYLMSCASKIRSASVLGLGKSEKAAIISELEILGQTLKGAERGAFLLGLGYVAFHAWYPEVGNDAVYSSDQPSGKDATLRHWASVAWRSGVDAIELFTKLRRRASLEWAFAVNHCVFVGAMTARTHTDYDGYHRDLIGLRMHGALWHYRFADTDACVSIVRASRLWNSPGVLAGGTRDPETVRSVRALLVAARNALQDATPAFGESEIVQHWRDLELLENSVNSAVAQNPWLERRGVEGGTGTE